MSSAYRSAYDHVVGQKLADVREGREWLAPRMRGLHEVVEARISRILAGLTGIAGAAATGIIAATTGDDSATVVLAIGLLGLAGMWGFSRGAFSLVRRLLPIRPDAKLTGEQTRDLELIAESDLRPDAAEIERRAERLETASVALPMIGLTLLVPLFLHWLFAVFAWDEGARDFAAWIRISLVVVGHAHVALAICCYCFAKKIRVMDLEMLAQLRIHHEWMKSWAITIGVSCLPGILLILVPPLLVAITGAAFIPFMFMAMHKRVLNERLRLASAYPESYARIAEMPLFPVIVDPRSAEEQEREPDRHDEHPGADAGDRAQA